MNTLVLKYQYEIFKVLSRYVRDPTEVLYVTQDTFIKTYKALNKFRGNSVFYKKLINFHCFVPGLLSQNPLESSDEVYS